MNRSLKLDCSLSSMKQTLTVPDNFAGGIINQSWVFPFSVTFYFYCNRLHIRYSDIFCTPLHLSNNWSQFLLWKLRLNSKCVTLFFHCSFFYFSIGSDYFLNSWSHGVWISARPLEGAVLFVMSWRNSVHTDPCSLISINKPWC